MRQHYPSLIINPFELEKELIMLCNSFYKCNSKKALKAAYKSSPKLNTILKRYKNLKTLFNEAKKNASLMAILENSIFDEFSLSECCLLLALLIESKNPKCPSILNIQIYRRVFFFLEEVSNL